MAAEAVDEEHQRWLDSGWRQGSLITAADLVGAPVSWWPSTPTPDADTDLAVVITQTCDLVHHDQGKEPVVEFILVRQPKTTSDRFRRGRHPRILQFDVAGPQPPLREAVITHRGWMPRDVLLRIEPIGAVASADLPSLQAWLGNRYTRKAMPDAFWERLRDKKQQKTLRAVLEACGADVIEVFIALIPREEELPPGTPYTVAVKVAVPRGVKTDAAAHRRVAEDVLEPLIGLFKKAEDFILLTDDCEVTGAHELSLELRIELETLDYSYTPLDDDAG